MISIESKNIFTNINNWFVVNYNEEIELALMNKYEYEIIYFNLISGIIELFDSITNEIYIDNKKDKYNR